MKSLRLMELFLFDVLNCPGVQLEAWLFYLVTYLKPVLLRICCELLNILLVTWDFCDMKAISSMSLWWTTFVSTRREISLLDGSNTNFWQVEMTLSHEANSLALNYHSNKKDALVP